VSSLFPASSGLSREALGLGLRVPHYDYLFRYHPDIGYFEIITENFLSDAVLPAQNLAKVRAHYPVVLHGVSLNLLGHEPLDLGYLEAVRRLADRVDAAFVSDHLCWTGAHGIQHHDLLPMPYTRDLVEYAAERAHTVQRLLDRPFGLENLSSYVEFRESTLAEHEFYTQVVEQAGCHFMLDLNNIYVSSVNHHFDPHLYLRAIDFSRVLQVHIAGHQREPRGTIVDTHDRPVCAEVWQLYAEAWRAGGPFPTLLEWDDAIPPMPDVIAELLRARTVRQA
jgi:uncharacterized protein (UPF0276 family)